MKEHPKVIRIEGEVCKIFMDLALERTVFTHTNFTLTEKDEALRWAKKIRDIEHKAWSIVAQKHPHVLTDTEYFWSYHGTVCDFGFIRPKVVDPYG